MNTGTKIHQQAILRTQWFVLIFIIFYSVGIAGLSINFTRELFIRLVPLALLLGFAVLLIFHEGEFSAKTIIAFTLVWLISFLVEAAGVATGKIFGFYQYGETLGIKLLETPLIIGINWLFLVYVTASIASHFKMNGLVAAVFASGLMVFYDIVLEQLATILGMWSWQNNLIPLQNYVAWFILSLAFQLLFQWLKIETKNKIAPWLFGLQFLFFLILYFIFN
jgi:putative membrane protein